MSSSKTRAGLLLFTTLFLMSLSNMAYADHKDGRGRKACKADVTQYCSQVNPGEGRVLACLQQHQSQLQPACQEKLPKWAKLQQMKQTCQADREKFCPQADRGKQVRTCMRKNHDLLSAQCRAAIDEIKAWRRLHPLANHWESLRSLYI